MDPLANIDKEVEAWLANTPEEELLRLWRESEPEKYRGTVTVSEYIQAVERLLETKRYATVIDEEPLTVTSLDVKISPAITFLVSVPGRVHATVSTKGGLYFVHQTPQTIA